MREQEEQIIRKMEKKSNDRKQYRSRNTVEIKSDKVERKNEEKNR